MRLVWALFGIHLGALVFGLAGIMIALPNPELWADSRYGPEIFRFGIDYGGSVHIWWGALTMLVFGGLTIGWRTTLIFFVFATTISLSAELIGTATGLPFGDYEYLDGLGTKVLGRVPYTIPLSWFYLGFTSYLIANSLAGSTRSIRQPVLAIAGGTYLLVVWDLVLDPAMAHDSMPIRFWTWNDTGPYFGMPLINFAGWALTGALFMTVTRLVWREDPHPDSQRSSLPFLMYFVNVAFGVVLAIDVGLWIPALLAIALGVLPASYIELRRRGTSEPDGTSIGYGIMKRGARTVQSRRLKLNIEGMENVPDSSPVILVARHFHHLYDGTVLIASMNRPVRIVVGLDWISNRLLRKVMELACRSVSWPIIVRRDGPAFADGTSAYQDEEITSYLRRAVKESVALLRSGQVLVIFPEAFPNIDPSPTPKTGTETFLPFHDGFARIARLAERDGHTRVAIIPVGLDYLRNSPDAESWTVTMRVGRPITPSERLPDDQLIQRMEEAVIHLSQTSQVARPSAQSNLVTS